MTEDDTLILKCDCGLHEAGPDYWIRDHANYHYNEGHKVQVNCDRGPGCYTIHWIPTRTENWKAPSRMKFEVGNK